jgi:hypothetical protein
MQKYITYSVAAFFAMALICLAGPDKAAIEAKENAAWQAFKDKKADDFKKVVDKDVRCVYPDSISNLQKELESMKTSDIKSFTISDFEAFSDEKDVMITTYTVKLEGMLDGKDASGTYNAGSVWKQENGKWLAIFHTNVKQEAAAK